jgi:putative FmdB family regulatory protein
MPIYEYSCLQCGKHSSILVLSINTPLSASCQHCASEKLERIMSRFSAPRSEEARLESLADPSNFGGLDENDPQSMNRFMKKMGQEMGEDFGGDVEAALEDGGTVGAESDGIDSD